MCAYLRLKLMKFTYCCCNDSFALTDLIIDARKLFLSQQISCTKTAYHSLEHPNVLCFAIKRSK